MATASRTYGPASINDPATWTEVGDSASVAVGFSADNGGCLEWTTGGNVTTQRERMRHGALSWESLFSIPAGSTVTNIQVTGWNEADWNANITTRTAQLRFVNSGGTTVHSAGDLFDTGAGTPSNTAGSPVSKGAGTSRAVDAGSQPSATLVRLEIDLAIVTTTGVLDWEAQQVAVTITYTPPVVAAGGQWPLRIPNPNVGPMALRRLFRRVTGWASNPGSTRTITASVNGVTTVTATVNKTAVLGPTVNGTSSVTATIVRTRVLTPTVNGVATVTATVVKTAVLAPTVNGVTTVTATVVRIRAIPITVNGTSAVTATIVRTRVLTPSVTGSSTVTVGIVRTRVIAATVNGVTVVTATVTNSSTPAVTPNDFADGWISYYYG